MENATCRCTAGCEHRLYSSPAVRILNFARVAGHPWNESDRYAAWMALWNFVGRATELARLTAAATSSSGRGLIFSGDAGIGKSRLLREAVEQLPTRPVRGLDGLRQHRQRRTAVRRAGPGAPGRPAGRSLRRRPAALGASTRCTSRPPVAPIVLAIDDAHLLDPSSAALVYLIARAENATVLCTVRSGEQIPLSIRALWTDDLVEHAELEPVEPGRDAQPVERDARRSARRALRRPAVAAHPGQRADAARAGDRRAHQQRAGPERVRDLDAGPADSELAPSLDRSDRHPDRAAQPGRTARCSNWSPSASRSGCDCCRRRPTRRTWRRPRSAA